MPRLPLVVASIVFLSAMGMPINAEQITPPPGFDSTRIAFIPFGGFGSSTMAQSYFAGGVPVIHLPGGVAIDPFNTGIGMTLADPAADARRQAAAQQRYQIESAQAAQSYQQTMMMNQQAHLRADAQSRAKAAMRGGYDPKTGSPRIPSTAPKPKAGAPLFDADGKVLWPEFAPKNQRREAAEAAMTAARADAKANGSAGVAVTVAAKQALRDYGVPAIRNVPGGSRILGERLREQLVRLDESLDALVETPASDAR